MTDLGDGFGPFTPWTLDIVPPETNTDQKNVSSYGTAIEEKAKEELQAIRDKTHEESKLRNKAKELQARIDKAYTRSRNENVRKKFKEMRDKLNLELAQIEDQLKDYQINRK